MSKEISLQQPGRRVTIGLHEKKEKLNNILKNDFSNYEGFNDI